MKLSVCAALGMLLASLSVFPQATQADKDLPIISGRQLVKAGESIVSTVRNAPIYNPLRCDAEEDVYFRTYDPTNPTITVNRINPKGELAKFVISSDLELRKGTTSDFSLSPAGRLLIPVQLGNSVYIVEFDNDGTIRRKTRLDHEFWLAHMAVFGDGTYFVTGTEIDVNDKNRKGEFFNAMFNDSGQMMRRIRLRSDGSLQKDEVFSKALTKAALSTKQVSAGLGAAKVEPNDVPSSISYESVKPPDMALTLGDAQADVAGNVYVLRHSSPATIYVFSQGGQYEKQFRVKSPDAEKMAVSTMLVGQGRIALVFAEMGEKDNAKRTLIFINSIEGKEVERFDIAPEFGIGPVCITPTSVDFFAVKDGKIALQRAVTN